jgi:6-methylsalicylate decarboxylase
LPGDGSAKLGRQTNEFLASLRDKDPSRYGFFAAMPTLTNTAAALAEIAYALDELKADGVTLFTRYGEGHTYLGHETFVPIWKALNERRAVVFIHPTHAVDTALVARNLPQPIVDYPHETTRAATSLIASNTLKDHAADCKIILSHAGGTLPYLANRVAVLQDVGMLDKSHEDILAEIGSFYFDVALSSSKEVIQLLLHYTRPDHLLFGTDYPYAPKKTVTKITEAFDGADLPEELKRAINHENALRLFPRLQKNRAN